MVLATACAAPIGCPANLGAPSDGGAAPLADAEIPAPDPVDEEPKRDFPPGDPRNKIPERFRQPLVFPEETTRAVEVPRPTRTSLNLSDGAERCPEGNRGELYIVRDRAPTERMTFEQFIDGPTGLDLAMTRGGNRRAAPLSAIDPKAKSFEVWPCQGQPYRPPDPTTTYVIATRGGFAKLVDKSDTRRPIVRNIAAIIVD